MLTGQGTLSFRRLPLCLSQEQSGTKPAPNTPPLLYLHVVDAHLHRPWVVCKGPIERFDVFEFKHVPLHKRFPNSLISPGDEELVIMIGLLRQSRGKVNWSLQIHSFPVERSVAEAKLGSW